MEGTAVTEKPDQQDRVKTSGRYRKVEVRTWGDAKFRALSPIPPCGQGLWLFLITGPHTGPIPGLFRAGRAAMAEELGWETKDFDEAFREAFEQGMVEADFKARVMWIPKAILHNKPESPNVVKSWAAEFNLIPECDLKWKAFEALKASIHALGEAYGEAFDKTFAKPSGKPSLNASAKTIPNQEQEQKQEQEQEWEEKGANAPNQSTSLASPVPRAQAPTLALIRDPQEIPPCPVKQLVALFSLKLPELPKPRYEMWKDSTGAEAMRRRWKWLLSPEATREDNTRYATTASEATQWFSRFFDAVAASDFLTGRSGDWSNCDLAWLMKRENFIKVVQGNYGNKARKAA
ncbi:MAG: hypothetical protein K0S57_78 [Ramlibacter sp.]|jgi:hypothetical protein|nr:hypothetical protein [Ramlibacter sp.]